MARNPPSIAEFPMIYEDIIERMSILLSIKKTPPALLIALLLYKYESYI